MQRRGYIVAVTTLLTICLYLGITVSAGSILAVSNPSGLEVKSAPAIPEPEGSDAERAAAKVLVTRNGTDEITIEWEDSTRYITKSSISAEIHSDHAADLTELVNERREEAGLGLLEYDPFLEIAALQRCAEIYLGYEDIRPDGSLWYRDDKLPSDISGENMGRDFANAGHVFRNWADSPGHAMNMDNPRFKRFATACILVDNESFWVQLYGY